MGNDISQEIKEKENENNNINLSKVKAPDFYLNKNYPNNGNKSINEIIKDYIDGKSNSFQNNTKNIVINEENLFTPTFCIKQNIKKIDNIDINNNIENDNENIESKNIVENKNNQNDNINEKNENEILTKFDDTKKPDKTTYKIINNNEINTNNISNNNKKLEPGIKNNNININININIDIPKIKKSKSGKKFLNDSGKEKHHKNNKKLNEQENLDKNSLDSENKNNKSKKSNDSSNNNDSEQIIIKNKDSSIKTLELNPTFSRKNSKEIKMKASSLMKDIRKEYKFLKPLGGGHFGTVRKAHRRSDKEPYQYFAIKSISIRNLSQKDYNDLVKEVDIISGLDHPNIIKFYETYHDKYFFHIVMELCQGKEVFDNIANHGYMSEKKVVNIIFKVLLAIAHCHSRGITHRDLKPENILFESLKPDAEIKLIDFGLSRKYAKDEKMHTILGTPYYVAPEVLKGEYDEKCDIWSIGAMTYLMLCGDPPFTGSSNSEIFKKIVKNEVKFNPYKWKNISNNAKDFVKLCLNKNASERPSASKAVEHKWFSNVLKETHSLKNLPKNILINIKNFNIVDKFKQMIIKYLINTMNGGEEINIYKNAFYALNYYHNGWIEPSELKKGYTLSKIDIKDEEIEYLYSIIVENSKSGIDYTEFLMAGIDKKELFKQDKIEKAFNYFDINKSGFIEYEDLKEALLKMGRECMESNGICSIINEAINNLNNGQDNKSEKDVNDFFDEDIKEEDNNCKISKKDFFRIFSLG
jgi:calcium-dependent protein kinase